MVRAANTMARHYRETMTTLHRRAETRDTDEL